MIAPHKLRETLVSIERQLPENFSLLFDSKEAMWQYYSAIGASAAFDDRLEVSLKGSPLSKHNRFKIEDNSSVVYTL